MVLTSHLQSSFLVWVGFINGEHETASENRFLGHHTKQTVEVCGRLVETTATPCAQFSNGQSVASLSDLTQPGNSTLLKWVCLSLSFVPGWLAVPPSFCGRCGG